MGGKGLGTANGYYLKGWALQEGQDIVNIASLRGLVVNLSRYEDPKSLRPFS